MEKFLKYLRDGVRNTLSKTPVLERVLMTKSRLIHQFPPSRPFGLEEK